MAKTDRRMRQNASSCPIDTNDEMMDIADAATFCRISRWAMYKRAQRGLAPSHKVGKRLYFLKSELLAYTIDN